MKTYILDIETTMDHKTIWVCGLKDVASGEYVMIFHPKDLMSYITSGATFVGHNILTFDSRVLEKVWDVAIPLDQMVDTLVLSRLYVPDLKPNHKLDTLAKKYCGMEKLDFDDYDAGWSDEMEEYLIRDLDTTEAVWNILLDRMYGRWSDESIRLEHEVAWYTALQMEAGFKLDEKRALKLYTTYSHRKQEIYQELQQVFPPIVEQRWSEKTGKRLKDNVTVFNPNSSQQIIDRLSGLGVKFVEKTSKGNLKCDESVLENIQLPEAKVLLEYRKLTKFIPMVGSWIDHADSDGRIRGYVNTIGAITRRMSHSKPNLGQVPKKHEMGKECRECFLADEGFVLVGCDANALEFRMLAHYINDPEFTELVCQGAFHEFCMELLDIDDKDVCKTVEYAYLYGGQDPKLGSIVGKGKSTGALLRAKLETGIPGLGDLIGKLKSIAKKDGTIPSLDGGRTRVRSDHSILNTALQGGGAIVMKKALVLSEEMLEEYRKRELQRLVAQVHDEFQREAVPDIAKEVGECMRQGIIKAGEALNLRCPLDASWDVGQRWSDTH